MDQRTTTESGTKNLENLRKRLCEESIPFAKKLAKPFKQDNPREAEDIESAAYQGLAEAASKFDPGKGVKFRSWAALHVTGRVKDYLRSEGLEKSRVRGADPDRYQGMESPKPSESLDRAEEAAGTSARAAEVLGAIEPQLAEVLRLRLIRGLSVEATAAELGVSRATVVKRYRRALEAARGVKGSGSPPLPGDLPGDPPGDV